MAEINWNLLRPPTAGQAFMQGRQERTQADAADYQMRRQQSLDARADKQFTRQEQGWEREDSARAAAEPLVAKGDYAGAAKSVAALDPELAASLAKLGTEARAAVKAQAEQGAGVLMSALKLPADQRQAFVTSGFQRLGVDPAMIQGVNFADDAALQAEASQVMSVADQVAKDDRDRSFGLETEKFGHQKETDKTRLGFEGQRVGMEGQRLGLERQRVGLEGQRVAIARQEAGNKAAGVLTPAQSRKTETDLRKEFDGLPEVKNYRTVAQAAKDVKTLLAGPPSAQNDIAGIYKVMKTYDPTSVVRETEFATAQNAAGVPDQLRNMWNKALRGQRLNPTQRKEMIRSVESLANTASQRYSEIEGQYRTYAQDYGADPQRVAPQSAAKPDPLGIR